MGRPTASLESPLSDSSESLTVQDNRTGKTYTIPYVLKIVCILCAFCSCSHLFRITHNAIPVAAFHFTIALLPSGPSLVTHPPIWYKPELVKTDKELEDEELKALLTKKLREDKKKNKKKKPADGEAEAETEGAESKNDE